MTTGTFDISRENILKQLYVDSAYAAQAREITGVPEKFSKLIMITEDEVSYFDRIIKQALDECTTALSLYLGRCSAKKGAGSNTYIAEIELPANYPAERLQTLAAIIESIIACRCLQEWYLTTKPEEANIPTAKLRQLKERMRETLALRKRPVKE